MNSLTFSQRNGYSPIPKASIRECMPEEVRNAVSSCFSLLYQRCYDIGNSLEESIKKNIWVSFLNKKLNDFVSCGRFYDSSEIVISDTSAPWYSILELIEFVLDIIHKIGSDERFQKLYNYFVSHLNYHFTRLNYGYRIVNYKVVPITTDEEVSAIETAIKKSKDNVRDHLCKSLEHYSKRPDPDYSNSIKESISAVEAVCRDIANAKDLRGAINHLESKGIVIHNQFKQSLLYLYNYTNDGDTGIRHALLDETGAYKPTQAEAYYMLVTCSAFVNYLKMKQV